MVYGIGSVRLKSYTAEELKIDNLLPADLVVELRQTYFHLFWIPFFPLRKRWTGIRSDRQYHLGSAIESRLSRQKAVSRTPVSLYAGSMLVVLIIVFIIAWKTVIK
jgi:hypothetical protein